MEDTLQRVYKEQGPLGTYVAPPRHLEYMLRGMQSVAWNWLAVHPLLAIAQKPLDVPKARP